MNKTININGREMEFTEERQRRLIAAIIETQKLLDKEMSYSEDLRNNDTVEFYRAHIQKLNAYLD